ncbi:MAG: TetR family transcriptional regulator [Magnetospirillum sp. WYHS-4]
MPRKATPADHIIAATLDLAAQQGWKSLGLATVAAKAETSLAEIHSLFGDRAGILKAFLDRIDRQVLATVPDAADSPRDRLFDVVMRRFDALAPYKKALGAILRDAPFDPVVALLLLPRFGLSLAWMLEAAGLSAGGLCGLARVHGLAVIYATAFAAWMRDDSPDLNGTMAVLDRALRRGEALAGLCGNLGGRPRTPASGPVSG